MKAVTLIFVYLIAVSSSHPTEDDDGTLVKIESGPIKGHILRSIKGNDFWSFQEIPYASPPVGENRYRLPQPPKPWSDVLNTTKNQKICYQAKSRFSFLEISEDCLYINVYTPVKPGSNSSLPVLLWIHGGRYSAGSSTYEYYGPKFIMDEGVVVVTFNYRLGPFGFLATDDDLIPPGIGLEDQRYAFKWVNRNIHLFGGDNKKVTLVGESAGSAAVSDHLIGPWDNNEQLFHSVIMQSGSNLAGLIVGNPEITNATVIAQELAQKIDPTFTPSSTKDLLKFLQKVDAKDILELGISEMFIRKPGSVQVLQTYMDGNFKKVPVLLGFNSEESLLFDRFNVNETQLAEIDADPTLLISKGMNISPANRTIVGELYKKLYTNNTSFVKNRGAFIRSNTDSLFVTPMCKQTELCADIVPYYMYQFAYKGKLGGMMQFQPLPGIGAVVHAEDLHYMWEESGYNTDIDKFPKEDRLTMRRFIRMWTNFAKYHNPTPEDDPLLDNIRWPATGSDKIVYLNFNATLEIREDPRGNSRVRKIFDTYMEPPYLYYQ